MAAPPKEGGTFTPDDTAHMVRALDIALGALDRKDDRVFAAMPQTELRRRLAALIIAEATRGPIDAEGLSRRAVSILRISASETWAGAAPESGKGPGCLAS